MKKTAKRMMIVDAQNQFIRSYIVNPSMTSHGDPIGGTLGFLQIMNRLCADIRPDLFVIVWDGEGGSSKRRAKNRNYKFGRKPPKLNVKNRPRLNRWVNTMSQQEQDRNRLWQQLRVIEYVNETPMIQFRAPNVEADDVIAHIKSMPMFSEWQKVIVSSDQDFIQVLDEKTLLYRPTQKEILNQDRVVEKFNIHPKNFAIARSIVGDKSDNLDGIRGVGLKTVAKAYPFLSENKSYLLDDVKDYSEHQEESNLKVYDKVLENLDLMWDNYSVMQLDTPLISIQTANTIADTFKSYKPMFNKTEFKKMMSIDGFVATNLECLWTRFNSLVQEGTKFN